MRKGHDFHKDKGGEIVNLGQWEKNTHVSSFPCLTQPISLKNFCWWLRQLIALGSGVARLSVLTHTHTPPLLTSQWKKKPLPSLPQIDYSLHDSAKTLAHSPLVTLHCCLFILMQERKSCSFSCTGFFLVLTHTASWEPCSSNHDFPMQCHLRFQLYVLLTDWYGYVISLSF